MKVCIVAGARPNFMKIAPVVEEITRHNHRSNSLIKYFVVHTGQHYDQQMSKLFFDDLGMTNPDINLEIGSASHAVQTAEIMKRFEKACLQEEPTHVLVVGDVNSTIGCALVASKLGIKVIHVEAGLRSFDRTMPEEINRVLTDAISDLLFTTEESANENLRQEGIPEEKIHFVGNVMIDTLLKHKKKARESNILYTLGLIKDPSTDNTQQTADYCVLTLHRPSNVDDKENFQGIIEALSEISKQIPIIFPVHPRTMNRIKEFGLEKYFDWKLNKSTDPINPKNSINLIPPLGYLDFVQLMSSSKLVLTDSGGMQEETTILGIPCITIRSNTERPVTVKYGTNKVVGTSRNKIVDASLEALNGEFKVTTAPPLWDGKAAERIVGVLLKSQTNL